MIRILIGYSGSGKTYKLQEEIAHKDFGGITNAMGKVVLYLI